MSYSDDYVSVDLAITFVILDTLNIFLIDIFFLIDNRPTSRASVVTLVTLKSRLGVTQGH